MEKQYLFEAEKLGLTEKNIHLLRNKYNYKSIEINQVDSMTIENGKDLKNWFWVLFVGLALIGFVVYDISNLIIILNDDNTYNVYIERLLIPLFPMLLGIYTVIISLRNTKVMKVKIDSILYYFSLRKIIKLKQYDDFISHMRNIYKPLRIK